jgi:flagellar basal-body rod modification protein FlgD
MDWITENHEDFTMNIPGIDSFQQSATNGSEAASEGKGNAEMGREEFLQLLMTQMKHQDPMNPMKGQEFATHLAQFSSVEQLININETLETQGNSSEQLADSLKNSTAAGLIGKTVRAHGDTLALTGQDEMEIPFTLDRGAENVKVLISDAAGNPVRTLEFDQMNSGDQAISWNTRDAEGTPLPDGTYQVSVAASDANGDPVDAQTFLQGAVERVRFGEDDIELLVNGKRVPLSQIESVAP